MLTHFAELSLTFALFNESARNVSSPLAERPTVWLAMFALTLLSTAYTVVVMMYSGSGLVWSPANRSSSF